MGTFCHKMKGCDWSRGRFLDCQGSPNQPEWRDALTTGNAAVSGGPMQSTAQPAGRWSCDTGCELGDNFKAILLDKKCKLKHFHSSAGHGSTTYILHVANFPPPLGRQVTCTHVRTMASQPVLFWYAIYTVSSSTV